MNSNSTEPRGSLKIAYVVTAVAISCLMLGASFAMILQGTSTPSIPTVIQPGSMISEYSYVIFKDGTTTYVKNGTSGAIASSSLSSSTAIQFAIDAVNVSGGGAIYLKQATYTITTVLDITQRNLKIDADKGTNLTGAILPILRFIGHDFEWMWADIYANIEISNIDFFYTGAVATGSFLQFEKLQTDNRFGPAFLLRDLKIHSSTIATIPTDPTFVGLRLHDIIGGRYERMQIYNWGTGIEFEAGMNDHFAIPEDSEHNYFSHIVIARCYYGVYERSTGGHIYYTTWDKLKVNQFVKMGMNSIESGSVMNAPDFAESDSFYDGTYQTSFNTSGSVVINGGQFKSAHDALINGTNAHIITNGCFLAGSLLGFRLSQTYLTVNQNTYTSVTTLINSDTTLVVGYNDQIETTDMGTASITGGNHTVVVATGLIWWPWQVIITVRENITGTYWISQKWGNQGGASGTNAAFEVSFQNTPGASTWHIDWIAVCNGAPY